jgi:hypothetical protein
MSMLRNCPVASPPARAAIAGSLLGLCLTFAPLATLAQPVTVIVNGQAMQFDQPPIVQGGRVFVPLRGIFETLGASVVYSNGQINATSRGRSISLTIGSTHGIVDGRPVSLDVAPFVVGSRTLVPLRFVAESLGASVNWNDATSTVRITGGGGGGGGNPRPVPPPPPRPQPHVVTFTYSWPTGTIYNRTPQIRFQVNRPIQIGGFQILVDSRPAGNVQSNGQYFYAPAPFSLPMGTHRVRVRGQTVGGVPFDLNWTFNQAAY